MNTLEETTMASMVLTLTFYGLFKFGVINWYPTLLFLWSFLSKSDFLRCPIALINQILNGILMLRNLYRCSS